MTSEVGRDDAGMKGVCGLLGSLQTLGELLYKEDVGELALSVEGPRSVALGTIEVVEEDAFFGGLHMGGTADDGDAAGGGELVEEAGDKDEMADVVCEELEFVAELGFEGGEGHDAGVAKDAIERASEAFDILDAGADRRGFGEFAGDGSGLGGHLFDGLSGFVFASCGGEDVSAAKTEDAQGFFTESGIASC